LGIHKNSVVKLKEDEPLQYQLEKQLKKMQYAKRISGKMFYQEGDERYNTGAMRYMGE